MKKILMVDDNHEFRFCLHSLIKENSNVVVYEFESGYSAIEFLKVFDVDLIICDFNMPQGNGFEVLNYLTQQKKNIPFFLCTSDYIHQSSISYSPFQLFDKLEIKKLIQEIHNLGVLEKVPVRELG
jgi:CheY-like chemotaxis protein